MYARKGTFMRRLETLEFWPALLDKKDELSLRQLAGEFGVTPGAISAALKRTGVNRVPAPPGPRMNGRRRTSSVRDAIKNWESIGEGQPWSARFRPGSKDAAICAHYAKLGQVPDAEVARLAGVSIRTIASFRARHDIAGYKGPRRPSVSGKRKRSKIDPFVHLLGQVPDRIVAEKASVSLNAVRNYRVKKGIQASGKRGRPAARDITAVETRFEQGAKHAWRVVVGSEGTVVEGIVIAINLNEASEHALTRFKNGVVTQIEWVGTLL